jgi:hypothetical protein
VKPRDFFGRESTFCDQPVRGDLDDPAFWDDVNETEIKKENVQNVPIKRTGVRTATRTKSSLEMDMIWINAG